MTLVKLCGLMSRGDVEMAIDAGADMAGMVLSEGFRRSVLLEEAKAMAALAKGKVTSVGVFVDEPIERLASIALSTGIGMIQLHGSEGPEYISLAKETTGLPVIKSFHPGDPGIEDSLADLVLIDPGAGSGESFDYSSAGGIGRDFILAGGLTPDNVARAIAAAHPYAVDTSSGTEVDGIKDKERMRAFVRAVRSQDAEEVRI